LYGVTFKDIAPAAAGIVVVYPPPPSVAAIGTGPNTAVVHVLEEVALKFIPISGVFMRINVEPSEFGV